MKYDFYITGTIGCAYDWWTGQRGTSLEDVKRFLEENKNKEVNIAVSSPGGYLDDGIAMCELISITWPMQYVHHRHDSVCSDDSLHEGQKR